MWLGHDATWWSLVLAAAALVLAVPANLAANFLTPVLKNWWAERSQTATRKRIERLEQELSRLENEYPLITEATDFLLLGIGLLAYLTFIEMILVLFLISTLPGLLRELPIEMIIFVCAAGFIILALFMFFVRVEAFRAARSPSRRENLQASIRQLKEKPH